MMNKNISNPEKRFSVHLDTDDGEYFDIRISQRDVSFCLWDVHEYEINGMICDLKEQINMWKREKIDNV